MFELSENEWDFLRCSFVTSKQDNSISQEKRGGIRYLPFAFTEQGVAQIISPKSRQKHKIKNANNPIYRLLAF